MSGWLATNPQHGAHCTAHTPADRTGGELMDRIATDKPKRSRVVR
jgi:hypothetical protein